MQNQENVGYSILLSSLRARFVFFSVGQSDGVQLFVKIENGAALNYCRIAGTPSGYSTVDRSTLVLLVGQDAVLDAESYVALVNSTN